MLNAYICSVLSLFKIYCSDALAFICVFMLSAYCNYDAQILPFLYIHLDAFVFVESACRNYDARILAFLLYLS